MGVFRGLLGGFPEITMTYDVIIIGAGPAGLMAAKTAAEDGLKVALVERKKNVCQINRSCLQLLYVRGISPLAEGKTYTEPVSVETGSDYTRFNFRKLGFSVNYDGPLRPYLNWLQVSPSGNVVHRFKVNDSVWGFHYWKEAFLAGLLSEVESLGVTVLRETAGLAAENTKSGVRVHIRGEISRRHRTLEAHNAVVAEGIKSRISETLGIEQKRKLISTKFARGIWYLVEGLESPYPDASLLTFTVPSLYERNVIIGQMGANMHSVTAGVLPFETLAAHPLLAPMLRRARVVNKMHFTNFVRSPLQDLTAGNIVIAGDSTAPTETWIQGAVACGFQAVKAIEKERNNGNGYQEYKDWWQQAYSFNTPNYFKILSDGYALNRVCNDEELDYVYGLLRDDIGIPAVMVDTKLAVIKKDRPELYKKIARRTKKTMWKKKS